MTQHFNHLEKNSIKCQHLQNKTESIGTKSNKSSGSMKKIPNLSNNLTTKRKKNNLSCRMNYNKEKSVNKVKKREKPSKII